MMTEAANWDTKRGWRWGGFFLAGQIVLVGIFYWRLPPEVPLFFSKPAGMEQLAAGWLLILLPGLGALFQIINWLVISLFKDLGSIIVSIVGWMTGLTNFLSFVALVHILFLVF